MAHLSDYIQIKDYDTVHIQDADIPICFNMETMEYVAQAYGTTFLQFEAELNSMLMDKEIKLDSKKMKIIRCLTYGMIRSAGTECTYEELSRSIPLDQLPDILSKVLEVFNASYFDDKNLKKLKK